MTGRDYLLSLAISIAINLSGFAVMLVVATATLVWWVPAAVGFAVMLGLTGALAGWAYHMDVG